MMDGILSLLAFAGFVGFLLILAIWVREPDLIVVISIGVAMAGYDFWRSWRAGRNGG